jgi:hypothetical protein
MLTHLTGAEWANIIASINAIGLAFSPFVISQGKHHLPAWYREQNLPGINVSVNG